MALFQKTVEQKYLKQFNPEFISAKYLEFKDYFWNPDIQENIRNSKEEQFQEGFLRELFVKILGYTLNPTPNFNLTTEYKNIKDSKKADGAIIFNDSVKAVIELKGTNTTDLSKIEAQAFGYKNNQPDCVYVVTSNFEKLRFYIDNAIENIEFNLFTLTKADFEILYLCLSFESIEKGIPKKVKEESLSQEDTITKKLYQDYSLFKRELHQNLVQLNPQYDSLTLFKKSQKLLDRFLFVFFAEDRHLLPPNFTRIIIRQWQQLRDLDEYIPLYERFKKNFRYLNDGFKGKDFEVYAYNGGLFKPDEILDSLTIDDDLLHKHTVILSERDFASEVDVNILGHIFENSLNELDEINAQLAGETIDKTKTKRKKDGVFYTPKYITKYIVENTVGKLCTEKKDELQIVEEEYITDKKRQLKTKQALLDKLKTYQSWLLQLTICDPACGSGAFLNQALDFLITEHRYIDELQAKLLDVPMIFSDIEKGILENNLFGVDLNEESVEIAKLSLWLRTAQPNRKLNDLNNNIKCGNSLIDDPAVAGDKAFNWHEAFPQVFEKGGFDVVIGNPPYVQSFSLKEEEKKFYYDNFRTAENRMNLYGLFIEKSINILKKDCLYGLIIPNYWLSTDNDFLLRKKVFVENYALSVFNTYQVFADATVDTVLLVGQKSIPIKETILLNIKRDYKTIDERLKAIGNHIISFETNCKFDSTSNLKTSFSKIINVKTARNLGDLFIVSLGIVPYREGMGTPVQTKEMCENKVFHSVEKIDDSYFPLLGARQLQRYNLLKNEYFIKYGSNLAEPRSLKLFTGNRLLVNRILSKRQVDVAFCDFSAVNNSDGFNLVPKTINFPIKAILAVVASRFCAFYFRSTNINLDRATFPKLNVKTLASFPLPDIKSAEIDNLVTLVDRMLSHHKQLQETAQKFQRTIHRKFNLEELSGKLNDWYLLSYADFIKELGKKKVKLSLKEEMEWEEFFLSESSIALAIKHQIDTTDKEIDQMVYALYGLTEEEIKIVEA